MLEILSKYWFPVALISPWGLFFYLKIREKKKFRNEVTGDFTSDTQVTLVNPAIVEAATRMIAEDEKRERKLVARYSRGNASLQLGRFTTQEDKDELFEGITSYRFIEEPTVKYVKDVIENIKIVLAIHKINFGQEGYDDPCFLLSVNQAEIRIRIYSDFFVLKKGTAETTAKLNTDDITQALKQIGVLK